VPDPITEWILGWDRGVSSNTIAGFMLYGVNGALMAARPPDAPHDTSDVGRCVRLLDIAERAGLDWRARMPELGAAFPRTWGKIASHWPRIEAAYRRDEAAQREANRAHEHGRWHSPKTGKRYKTPRGPIRATLPPSEAWWLCSWLRCDSAPTKSYPDRDGGGLWRPLGDLSPEPMEAPRA